MQNELKHDQLQAAAYQWAHNRFPQIEGHLFAARSEVIKGPNETEQQYVAKLGQLKAIGHRKGILDLHLDLPMHKGKPGKPFEFDAKVGKDYLKPDQIKRIDMMRACGGDGFEFRTLEQFQQIFEQIMRDQFGEDLVIRERQTLFTDAQLKKQRAALEQWKKEMRANM